MPDGLTQKQAAQRVSEEAGAEFTQATISRWLDAGYESTPEPARVAAFALAFGHPPLEAFVAAGLLDIKYARDGLDAGSLTLLRRISRGTKRVSRATLDVPERDTRPPRPRRR